MKIVLDKTKYHRFGLYYDYDPEKVTFCQGLKESFGWEKFSFQSDGPKKRWIFSDTLFIPVIKERFPFAIVDPEVERLVAKEQAWSLKQQEISEQVDIIKNKKETDFTVNNLKSKLYDYQKVGVEFLVVSGGRAILADSPGLGKTCQALAFIKHQALKRTLVVCPASVKFVWGKEIKKWTNLTYVIIDSKTKIAEIDPTVQIWIINYDILAKNLIQLGKIRFDCLVGDESQLIKNLRAKRTKAFRILSREIPYIALLTGTPLLSRPSELFSLLNIIDPKTWTNFYEYARKYCNLRQTRWGIDFSGATNTEELHYRIRGYFIRRNKSEVLKELPPKNFIDVPVELSSEYAKKYETAARNLAEYLRRYAGKQPKEIARSLEAEKLSQLNVLRQLSALGKVDIAKEVIENIIDSGEKVLVFSSFVEPLKQLKNYFGDKAVILTGETSLVDRENIINSYQNDTNIKVFCGGIKSAGVGITLTAAANVLFLDYSWNPADHHQALDRAHRPGAEYESLNIYQLFASETIDEDLKEMLNKKQKIFDQVIEGVSSGETAKDTIEVAVQRIVKKYNKPLDK